jgi:hypothetical protein
MKKITLLAAFLIFAGMNVLLAQKQKANTIPSFKFHLTTVYTTFQEQNSTGNTQQREKRDMEVVISSSAGAPAPIPATVWVANEKGTEVLGPYEVFDGELLSVPIDNGKWGVVINCTWDANVDVWVD